MTKSIPIKKSVLLIIFLIVGVCFFSCKENSTINKNLLAGSWHDTSEAALHFSLLPDGTAHSDNMATLNYKNWRIEGNKIIFKIESIGNKTSSIEDVAYDIIKLTEKELVIKNENITERYVKN